MESLYQIPHYPLHYAHISPHEKIYPQQHYYLHTHLLNDCKKKQEMIYIALFTSSDTYHSICEFFKNYFIPTATSIHIFTTAAIVEQMQPSNLNLNLNPRFYEFHPYSSNLSHEDKKQLLDGLAIQWDVVIYDVQDADANAHICEDLEHLANELSLIQNYLNKATGVFIFENISMSIPLHEYSFYFEPFMNSNPENTLHFPNIFAVSLYFAAPVSPRHLFIFQKSIPVFNDEITIITPSIRPQNLKRILSSIDFKYFSRWIIVYDSRKITKNPHQFVDCPYIEEYLYSKQGPGRSGNDQRNFALSAIPTNYNGYIYFLDDDNIIHPNFYHLLNNVVNGGPKKRIELYSFDQERYNKTIILRGNQCRMNKIDSAMVLIPAPLCRTIRWKPQYYNADGRFIEEVYNRHSSNHVYIETIGCYYNSNQ